MEFLINEGFTKEIEELANEDITTTLKPGEYLLKDAVMRKLLNLKDIK